MTKALLELTAILAILLRLAQILSCEGKKEVHQKLNYKVALPEYICNRDGSVDEIKKHSTSIRILGRDAQNLSYKFSVSFKKIGAQCNQRCNLMTWKSVRELEEFLQRFPEDQMRLGVIEINNTMFMPGIQYILNVTVFREGEVVEEKTLTLDYVDEEAKKAVKKPLVSLFLMGADFGYSFVPYVVNAEVTICSNISGSYFSWKVLDKGGAPVEIPNEKGPELMILPNVLQTSQTYTIDCTLLEMETRKSLAHATQKVEILSRGLLVHLPVKTLTAQTNRAVSIAPYIKDLDNSIDEAKVAWGCMEVNTKEKCTFETSKAEEEMEQSFGSVGRYELTVEVTQGKATGTASCTIDVTEDSPNFEVEEFESPVSPSKGVTVKTNVYGLRTFCSLQWTSVSDENYEFLDLSSAPGGPDRSVNVTKKEDMFLSELDEFSNDTLEKEFDLVIPPPSNQWPGLKGDVTYLFRLVAKCPQVDDDTARAEPVVTTTDVTVVTNAPPKLGALEVKPMEGRAFETSFQFRTRKAEEKEGDGPVLYKFGYVSGQRDVIAWAVSDVTNVDVVLPFSANGVQTFLEACDIFESCSQISGPVVMTTLPQPITETFKRKVLQTFEDKMAAQNYNKAFVFAIELLNSISVKDEVMTRIDEEIQNVLKANDEDRSWRNSATALMGTISEFSSDLQIPESTLNGLGELKNKLSKTSEKSDYTRGTLRKLLTSVQPNDDSVTIEDIRGYLQISDLIITNSKDHQKVATEKRNVLKDLKKYTELVCQQAIKKPSNSQLELKTVLVEVEKFTWSNSYYAGIPFSGPNSWNVTGKIKLEEKGTGRKVCLGKAVLKDYLDKDGFVFMAESSYLKTAESEESSAEVTLLLPLDPAKVSGNSPFCRVFYDGGWKDDCQVVQMSASVIKCSCKYLGYYCVEYEAVIVDNGNVESRNDENGSVDLGKPGNGLAGNDSEVRLLDNTLAPRGDNYDTISYIFIVVFISIIAVMGCILKKNLNSNEEDSRDLFENHDFPKYAHLYDEENLNDGHI